MRRVWTLAAVLLLTLLCGGQLFSQVEAPKTRLLFGPCIGVTGIIVSPDEFNATLQAVYPTTDRHYFPAFTQMGIQSMQLVPMGDSKAYLSFHEMFLVGGLDQNMPIPSVELVLGYRFASGIETGLGPYFSLTAPGGQPKVAASVMYEVSWALTLNRFSMPIMLTLVPMPSYANPQISLLLGFTFESVQ